MKWNGSNWSPSAEKESIFMVDGNIIRYSDPTNQNKTLIIGTDLMEGGTQVQNKMMFFPSRRGAFRVSRITKQWDNSNVGDGSFASGINTIAKGYSSTAMGFEAEVKGRYSTAIGYMTITEGEFSTAMGHRAVAGGDYSTAIGSSASTEGDFSIAMGRVAKAKGHSSTAMGYETTTEAENSLIYGSYVSLRPNATGSVYLADGSRSSEGTRGIRVGKNRFYARFDGGYWFATDSTAAIGVYMNKGDNSWSSLSDSTKKENFLPLDKVALLQNIKKLKLGTWNYKEQDPTKYRHYGPMAQEFYHYFGKDKLGTIGNDTTIATADIDGVMLTAIQALIEENDRLKADNEVLKVDNEVLKVDNEVLKAQTSSLQSKTLSLEAKVQEIDQLKSGLEALELKLGLRNNERSLTKAKKAISRRNNIIPKTPHPEHNRLGRCVLQHAP